MINVEVEIPDCSGHFLAFQLNLNYNPLYLMLENCNSQTDIMLTWQYIYRIATRLSPSYNHYYTA